MTAQIIHLPTFYHCPPDHDHGTMGAEWVAFQTASAEAMNRPAYFSAALVQANAAHDEQPAIAPLAVICAALVALVMGCVIGGLATRGIADAAATVLQADEMKGY